VTKSDSKFMAPQPSCYSLGNSPDAAFLSLTSHRVHICALPISTAATLRPAPSFSKAFNKRGGEYSVHGRCFDIRITTRAALAHFQESGDAWDSGEPSESASGIGSIIRLAPVPIRYAGLFPEQIKELTRLAGLVQGTGQKETADPCKRSRKLPHSVYIRRRVKRRLSKNRM
jgi:hypothetical protein